MDNWQADLQLHNNLVAIPPVKQTETEKKAKSTMNIEQCALWSDSGAGRNYCERTKMKNSFLLFFGVRFKINPPINVVELAYKLRCECIYLFNFGINSEGTFLFHVTSGTLHLQNGRDTAASN